MGRVQSKNDYFNGALSMTLKNPGHDDRWTCPGCYQDLATHSTGVYQCDNCKRMVNCDMESQPVCVSNLVDPTGADADGE